MPNRTFAEIFDEMLILRGCSLGQIATRLAEQGYHTNRSTLMRWRNGENRPSFENLEVLRHLPKAMGLSAQESARFLNEISHALGFIVTEMQPAQVAAEPLAQRLHFGSETLLPFVGRQADLSELQQRVTKKQPVAIVGLAGMGKTRLAQALLQASVKDFAHGCEFLEIVPGQDKLQVAQAVAHLLDVDLPLAIPQENSLEWVLEQIHARRAGASLLFLVDNVESTEQVRELVRRLPQITWIFTARRLSLKNTGVYTLQIAPPPAEEAIRIFQAFAPSATTGTAALGEIVEALGRLPLALRLAASLVDSGLVADLTELRGWLAQKGWLNARLLPDLRLLFDFLFSKLSEDAQRIFELCGAFAIPRINLIHLNRILHTLPGLASLAAWNALGDLSLITRPDNQHIEIHHLVHEYAQLRLRASPQYVTLWGQFQAYYLELLENTTKSGDEAHRDYRSLLSEEPNWLGIIINEFQASNWTMLERLWPIVENYYWQTRNLSADENFTQMCLCAAQKSGHQHWLAEIYSKYGFLKIEMKHYDAAEELMLNAQAIHDQFPAERFEQARVRRYRALLAIGSDKLDKAASLLAEAESLFATLSESVEPRLATNYLWLHTAKMNVFMRQGHLGQALDEGKIADQYYTQLNQDGYFRAHDYKVILGDLLFMLGRAAEAEKNWLEMLDVRDDLPYQAEEGDALVRLGWLHSQAGENAQALDVFSLSGQIFLRYGDLEKKGVVDWLTSQIQAGFHLSTFAEIFSRWH